ncbi:MAG TPA: sigma-70 family RNA polymerase sigma factor [Thermoanaerobaculia bacterium]|nr:sigma-70 family RNA polymerase sigma factor [Thermoanaerobaculia bacterium]
MTADAFVIDIQTAVRSAREGDEAAFENIMILTEKQVARIAWRILGDAEEVKDAMQETYLRVFRHLGRYDDTQNLLGWMTKITVNVCRDQLRRRRRLRIFHPLDDSVIVASNDVPADVDLTRRDEAALLRRAIDSLPPKERLALILRDVEELPTAEVAAALGNSVATVRVQLSRARVRLRRFIDARRGRTA